MKSTINLKYWLFFAVAVFISVSAAAEWEDLSSGEKKVFGSEKEQKYPINSYVVEKEQWENHYSLMILGLYKYTDYPKYTSLRVLPFYYHLESKIDDRKKTVFFLPYPYYSRTENNEVLKAHLLGYSFTTPESVDWSLLYLFYYGKNRDENSKYNALFPFYKFSRTDNSNTYSSSFITPFFYFSSNSKKDDSGNMTKYKSSFGSLLFYRSEYSSNPDEIRNGNFNRKILFPLLPVIYFNSTDENNNSHSAFLSVFHWYKKDSGIDKILSPVISWHKEDYTIIWPLLSFNFSPDDGFYDYMINPVFMWGNDSFFHFLPLLTFNWNAGSDHSYHNMWNPVFSWEKDNSFNFHPLLSFNHYGDDYKMHLNPLFVYYRDDNLRTTAFPLIPFIWYHRTEISQGKDTYNILTLFRFNKFSDSENGSSISPLHYYKRNDEKSIFISPLYYNYANFSDDTKYRGLVPLYFSWQNSENKGSFLLPVYFSNRSNDSSFSVNILGLASRYATGPFNPSAGVSAGKFENVWYFDFSFSWLYNLFSVYYRLPLSSKADLYETSEINKDDIITEDRLNELRNTEAFLSSENNSRSESLTFYGIDLLYGLFSYQKSDHMKHIRLLPLAWFTWYDNSDDKVNFVPLAYFYYKKDDLKYLIIFPGFIPIYGEQTDGLSYTKAYGMIMYWDIYNDEKKSSSKYVLWPFFKSYTTPDSDGWRLFPLIWHKTRREENETRSYTLMLPFYYSSDIDVTGTEDSSSYSTHFSINPLMYRYTERTDSSYSSTLTFPLLPLYYRYRSDSESSDRLLYNLAAYKKDNSGSTLELLFGIYHDRKYSNADLSIHRNWLMPLYFYSKQEGGDQKSLTFMTLLNYYKKDSEGTTINFPLIPLYHHRKTDTEKHINVLANLYASNNNEKFISKTYLFGLCYDRNYKNEESHLNWILPFYFNYETGDDRYNFYVLNLYYRHYSPEEKSFSVLWPLFYHNRSQNGTVTTVFPLAYYSHYADGTTDKNAFVSPFLIFSRKSFNDSGMKTKLFSVPLLLQYSYSGSKNGNNLFRNGFLLGYYYNVRSDYNRHNFLYLADYRNDISAHETDYGLLFNAIKLNLTPDYYNFKLAYGLAFNYRNYNDTPDYELSLFTFMYEQYRTGNDFYSSLFPIYWYKKNDQYTRSVILPLLGYSYKDPDYLYNMYGMGLVWFHYTDYVNDYEKKLLFLGTLYDYTHKSLRDYTSHSQFWGLLWNYEYEDTSDYWSFSVLKFLYKRVHQNGVVKNKILGVTVSENRSE